MSESETIRQALIAAEVVTAPQWAAARAAGGSPLWALTRQPAWWSADGSAKALTEYHVKLIDGLCKSGALGSLARRLRAGPYLVRAELGRGGMGVVYRAVDLRTRGEVALKRVRSQSRQVVERFRREAAILARLDHPAVARFLGAERHDGQEFLIMEYVPGETASRAVRRLVRAGGRLPWPQAVSWTTQVLDALAHAHGRGVVHRDIKPGNIMVTGPNEASVKLLDVGLAKCAGVAAGTDLTQADQVLGTSEYMPPEQWTGGHTVCPAADLYALGGSLFYFLTGRSPYAGETTYQQMMQHLSAEPPDVRSSRPDAPEALAEVVRRMMAKAPADRGSPRELKWQLSAVVSGYRGPAAHEAPVWPAEPASGVSRESFRPSAPTVAQADASTAVTTGIWPLLCELGREVKVLAGLAPRRRVSVFDAPPAGRILSLSLAVGFTVCDRLRGRR